jgi:hypothetical protein
LQECSASGASHARWAASRVAPHATSRTHYTSATAQHPSPLSIGLAAVANGASESGRRPGSGREEGKEGD